MLNMGNGLLLPKPTLLDHIDKPLAGRVVSTQHSRAARPRGLKKMVKHAICMSTINRISNLGSYKKHFPDYVPIVTGDLKAAPYHAENKKLCEACGGVYLTPEDQMKLGFLHAGCGWGSYARKNVAYLFALREGAEVVYSIDDDCQPAEDGSVGGAAVCVGQEAQLWTYESPEGFYNIYADARPSMLDPHFKFDPPLRPRGFPWHIPFELEASDETEMYKVPQKVLVQVGLHIGDPDVDAATRLTRRPYIGHYDTADPVYALNPNTWTPYDTQNTFIHRSVMPLHAIWGCPSDGSVGEGWRRFDDIPASYVAQAIMQQRGLGAVVFGRPWAYQDRNEHDLVSDLRFEIGGLAAQKEFLRLCRAFAEREPRNGQSLLELYAEVYSHILEYVPGAPKHLKTLLDTWVLDLQSISDEWS